MGGMKTVVGIVKGLIEELNITVPVALHLDHGTFEGAKKAIKEGYTSIMYDGSHEIFEKNLQNSKKIIELAKEKKQSIEVEIGTIGGEEDGMIGNGDLADLKEISKMSKLGPDMIAAGIGNFHGPYPKD
jgi:fructose-bisphosphate aldolase class II